MKFVGTAMVSSSTPRWTRKRYFEGRKPMPAPRSSSSTGDRSNTVTSCPASASTHAAVKPPSDPPTTAMSTLGSGLTEGGDLVDRALEQHAPLVDRGITQAVWARLLCVLRPDLVEMGSDSRAF